MKMKALKKFINDRLLDFHFGEYKGVIDISLPELYQLKELVEASILEKQPDLE